MVPIPRWVAGVNKRFTNRLTIALHRRPPFAALTHVGRRSGHSYRIPINAFPTDDGFVFALTYGPHTDWVENVMAAGGAKLEYAGEVVELGRPERLDRSEAVRFLPRPVRAMTRLLGVTDFLRLRRRPFSPRP